MILLFVLTVKGRPPDLHQQGQHRMAKATVIRERRGLVKLLAQGERHRAGLAIATEKRRLHVTVWWKGTKRDDPNLLQDLKADIDGFKDAGWLVDDNRDWLAIDYPVTYVEALTRQDEKVEYRLYSLAG